MREEDWWLLIILLYTLMGHLTLEAFEAYTMKMRWITWEAALMVLFYCVVWACYEYGMKG